MMRRARISVKPNFRPANREASVGEQSSQAVKESGDTLQTSPAAKAVSLAPTNQQNTSTDESAQDGGVKIDPSLPSENSSANLNDSTPSSGTTVPVAAPHRRMRISAAPKLAGPKVTSTPRTSTRVPSSALSAKSSEKIEESQGSASITQAPVLISGNEHDSLAPKSTSTELSIEPSTAHPPSSPCLPSTSGLQKPTVCVKKSTDSQSSSKPGKIPQQCLQNPEPETCSTSVTLKRSDDIDSPEPTGKSSDKDRILRALKLKELMKIERRRDIKKGKKRVAHKEYTAVDHSKMTMRDLIYYLPNTSPLRFSEDRAEDHTETIVPPSSTMAIKKPEEEEAAESEDEEVLVPKVRVAEDGSIILDEDSLTVRVKRSSNTTLVETALFERGSTTTYSSFRQWNYVKSWSVRETDMFFLALSMVGIDFTLIGHLLTHRSRAAIKSKFKREERENSWRIDKALRNKRPFDREFFAFLLEKVLAKDKKGKSVKLVMTKPKKEKKGKGKVAKASEQDVYMEDSGCVDAEKENEDLSNVNKTPNTAPAKKKRKRKKEQIEDVDVEEETGKQGVIKKRRKYSKKTQKEKPLSIDVAEDESGLLNLETVEEQSRASETKKKRRRTKKAEEEKQDERPDPIEGNKSKRRRKTLKVSQDHANSISAHEESSSGCVDLEVATKSTHKGDLNPVIEESNTIKCTVQDKEAAEDHEEKEKTEAVEMVPQKSARRLKKPLPKLPRGRRKKFTDAPADVEMQENELVNENTSVLTVSDDSLEDDRLQQQALVVLERTPPRVKTALNPCKALGKKKEPKSSVDPQASPSTSEASSYHQTRIQRADKVKRGRGMMDEADPGTSAVVQSSPTVLLERVILPESEHSESDNPLDENIMDLSCLTDFDSKMCLRRPMVVLSREEVDGILNSQDDEDEGEPSLSPLDLSLNTELSFQHPCSSLMLDNTEVSQLESVEENEERPWGGHSHCVAHEERQNEDQEVTTALVQHDTSNPKDLSKSFNSEASVREISKVEILGPMEEHETQVLLQTDREVTAANLFEAQTPLVVQADVASVDVKQHPIDKEMATTVIPEDTSSKASLTCLGVTRKPKKTLLATQIKDSLQESGLTSSEVLHHSVMVTPKHKEGSQETVMKIPKIKEGSQRSLVASPKINEGKQESVMMKPISKEGSQESVIAIPDTMYVSQEPVIVIPEIKKGSQESEMMRPIIKEGSQKSVIATPEMKKGSQESVMAMPEIKEGSQKSEMMKPIIKQGSQESVMEIKEGSQESMMVSFEMKGGSQESVMATSDMEKEGLMESRMATPEIKEGTQESAIVILEPMNESQESVMLPPEMKKGSQEPVIVIPEIKNGSQESEMMKPIIKEGSQESVMVIPEMKAGSQESVMVTPGMEKEGLTESGIAAPKIKEGSQESVMVAPDIMEGPQESVMASSETERLHRCVMATQVIKEGSQESVVPIQEMKKGFQESVTVTPEMKARSQKSLQETLEIKELLQKTPETSQRLKESREPTSKLKTGLLGSTTATSEVKEISAKHTSEVAPIVKNISLEKADLPSSSASAPSEHETSIKKRSRFIKPKPNLTSRAAGLQNKRQTLPVKASMADLTVGSEKDVQTGDFSKESSSKKEDMVVDPMETHPAKVLGGRTKVLEQELITSLTLSADEANTASEQPDSLCDVHMIPSCEPDLSKVETACPLPIQAIEHEKTGLQDSCAPAEIINSTQDGQEDEEPIFILTLYEIPVTEVYPACNHKEATSNLQAQSPLLFPDQVHVVPSTSESTRSFMGNAMYVELENAEPAMEPTSASLRTVDLQTTDEPHEESGDLKTKNHSTLAKSECKENSDLVQLEDLQPSIDSQAQDSEEPTQCQDMLHTVLPDIFIHPLEEIEDHLSKQCSITVECTSKDKCSSTPEESPETTHEEPTKVKLKRESIIAATKSEAAHTSSPESELSKNTKHDQACSENSARNVSAFKQDMTSEDKRSFDSLTVDPEDIKTNCEGVSHVLLADVFVPVSEDPIDLSHDWCVESSSHRGTTSPKTKEVPIKKVFENRDISESSTEEAKMIPSLKCKTLSRRRGKKQMKRACTNNDSPSPQLNTFAQNEDSFNDPAKMEKKEISDVNPSEEAKDMENLEPTLQRKRCIIPCAVSLSRCTDSLPEDWEENANVSRKQVKEAASSAFTSTEELKEPSEMEAVKSGKKSSLRKKGKQTGRKIKPLKMKMPDVEHLPLTRTVPQTRQLNITAWAKKKSLQTKTKLDETVETVSQVMPLSKAEESSPQDSVASEDQSVLPNEKSLSCSKSKNEDLKETLGFSCSVPALEDAEEACSSHQVKTSAENVKESSEETSVPQVKKPSARLKAKHQAKSRWSKRMSASKSDQEKPTQLTLPTRHSGSTTKVKKKSEETVKKSTQDTSRTETNSESKDGTLSRVPPFPKSRDLWPKLVLPRVNLSTTECGSDSSASTASPARVSRTATTTRLKKSPIIIRGSSSVSEDTDNDPSRVSQFTLCDIFTEVDDTE